MTARRLIKSSKGQAMAEYIIVVSCVALVFMAYSGWMSKAIVLLFRQVVSVFHLPIP